MVVSKHNWQQNLLSRLTLHSIIIDLTKHKSCQLTAPDWQGKERRSSGRYCAGSRQPTRCKRLGLVISVDKSPHCKRRMTFKLIQSRKVRVK